jgi:DNA (cytosine-5)-methyltransferase 1
MALGRIASDIAINHDAEALAMHRANHPRHEAPVGNVMEGRPACRDRRPPVGLLWASPDCKHHSKAKGGKPVKREIRDLAWVVVLWAKRCARGHHPRERRGVPAMGTAHDSRATLPEIARARPSTHGSELRRLGYKVEWRELRACDYGAPTIRKRLFVIAGATAGRSSGRSRRMARRIASRSKPGFLKAWRAAAEIIDWSLPCHSIFLTREEGRAVGVNRPLAEHDGADRQGREALRLDAAEPFIVPVTHAGDDRVHGIGEPLRTQTTAHRGEHALVTPFVSAYYGTGNGGDDRTAPADEPLRTQTTENRHAIIAPYLVPRYGERLGQEPRTRSIEEPAPVVVPTANGGSLVAAHLTKFNTGSVGSSLEEPAPTVTANSFIKRPGGAAPIGVVAAHVSRQFGASVGSGADEPIGTVTAGGGGKSALVSAFLAQHNTDMVGHDAREPVSTIVQKGCTQAVVEASFLTHHYTSNTAGGAGDMRDPKKTVLAGGTHAAEVRAFLTKYYGSDQDPRLDEPLHTATTKDRFGIVTVDIGGEPYVIVDIGMRMLTPRELFRAQGFPDSYVIAKGMDAAGNAVALNKTAQVRMCGNSVCPPLAEALARANYSEIEIGAETQTLAPTTPLFDAADPSIARVAS